VSGVDVSVDFVPGRQTAEFHLVDAVTRLDVPIIVTGLTGALRVHA
jgi:hypothetical protein